MGRWKHQDQFHRAAATFKQRFERPPRFAAVAPGRVNLIGDHTDYNDGFVLPLAIERQTLVVADRRRDRTVRLASTAKAELARFENSSSPPLAPSHPQWANYVKGVMAGCLTAGLHAGGFDGLVDSTVPVGAGLSSSAALEVAAATLIEQMCNCKLDPPAKALLCQKAEHDFAGVPCGIMDQFIAVMARAGHAMLLDCRSRQVKMVDLTDPSVSILIVNSQVHHDLAEGQYADRRLTCHRAAKTLGLKALRDADMGMLTDSGLDPTSLRRARHVISENQRTREAAAAMEAGDWRHLGTLMDRSHDSLRDDFEVSCDELDLLVDLAHRQDGVYGARMTGGGFGGCTVNLVHSDRIDPISNQIHSQYRKQTGIEPTIFATRPAEGARGL